MTQFYVAIFPPGLGAVRVVDSEESRGLRLTPTDRVMDIQARTRSDAVREAERVRLRLQQDEPNVGPCLPFPKGPAR